ncbi:PEP-CTERM sorting domain-containing protein [candidate division KSB1 bacterium]|nr:PEP-CTERM sorting domain-containing protein [candidate division KSB1 bacterium]
MIFDLQAGKTVADVIADLNSGALRIGLHVRSIGAAGDSDSFVNGGGPPVQVIPEPSSILLLGSALIAFFVVGRIRRNSRG